VSARTRVPCPKCVLSLLPSRVGVLLLRRRAAGWGQVEPKLGALRGSAFLAVNDQYVEPADILSLKVPNPKP